MNERGSITAVDTVQYRAKSSFHAQETVSSYQRERGREGEKEKGKGKERERVRKFHEITTVDVCGW